MWSLGQFWLSLITIMIWLYLLTNYGKLVRLWHIWIYLSLNSLTNHSILSFEGLIPGISLGKCINSYKSGSIHTWTVRFITIKSCYSILSFKGLIYMIPGISWRKHTDRYKSGSIRTWTKRISYLHIVDNLLEETSEGRTLFIDGLDTLHDDDADFRIL